MIDNVVVIILVYNYFLGVVEFSYVDIWLIVEIKSVMVLIDVLVLDYFVVGDKEIVLFV